MKIWAMVGKAQGVGGTLLCEFVRRPGRLHKKQTQACAGSGRMRRPGAAAVPQFCHFHSKRSVRLMSSAPKPCTPVVTGFNRVPVVTDPAKWDVQVSLRQGSERRSRERAPAW